MKELLHRRSFSKDKIEARMSDKITIKERDQYCAKSGDPFDIIANTLDVIKTKNNSDKEKVASSSCLTLFRKELAEAGADPKNISLAKDPTTTEESNEIQKRQLIQGLANPSKTPKHFSLEEGLRRIQITTKIFTMQDLARYHHDLKEIKILCMCMYTKSQKKKKISYLSC
ncbi:16744_t:CDS:1 [Entrophospora sp. SA101]|nr:16741_t:CDS:1 [Entrophospora sp. SA101]CAJ0919587.1 16744_t:CDS:1 [Entrophospora sp. SA101]